MRGLLFLNAVIPKIRFALLQGISFSKNIFSFFVRVKKFPQVIENTREIIENMSEIIQNISDIFFAIYTRADFQMLGR